MTSLSAFSWAKLVWLTCVVGDKLKPKAFIAGLCVWLPKPNERLQITLVILFFWIGLPQAPAQTWIDKSYEDFVDGTFDGAGHNLYVSRDGKMRTIQRYDLNQDGYLDLIFNNTHDNYYDVPATLGTVDSDGRVRSLELAVEGTQRVVAADLNNNGYLDMVFCPDSFGIQNGRRFLSIIWGGPDGWPAHRSNGLLPVESATSIAVADLNKDGWPDLVALNGDAWMAGQPEGRIIRVFWGGKDGFLLDRFEDIGVPEAVTLAAGDFDGDGAIDLAVLAADRIRVFYAEDLGSPFSEDILLPVQGSSFLVAADYDVDGHVDLIAGTTNATLHTVRGRPGRAWHPVETIEAFSATRAAIADLDGDSWPDLVLTNFSLARSMGGEAVSTEGDFQDPVRVLWGGADGFSTERSSEIIVPHASATAIGDLNGDGMPDLTVAVYQGTSSYATESRVFLGSRERKFTPSKSGVPTKGAKDVVIVPAEHGFPARAVFANSQGGTLHEAVPLYIYWGGPAGFDPDRRKEIPFTSGYEASAADLNANGFVDLIVTNSGHAGPASAHAGFEIGVHILWGGPEGIDPEGTRTVLPAMGASSTEIADLNRDGYLDLVIGSFFDEMPGAVVPIRIYYGSSQGFNPDDVFELPNGSRSTTTLVADFNNDGWLDIAACTFRDNKVNIFWGSSEGFDPHRKTSISAPLPIEIETADLNSDGYLDLIVACYADLHARRHDLGTLIFWGSDKGFREYDAQWLPGFTTLGITVADFDNDGFLDLFLPNYHADGTRESIPCYIYWGSEEGFGRRNRTILIADSVSDAFAGDFDGDGLIDLAVSSHTRDGSHQHFSKVFYNDGQRFANPRIEHLPTKGPHWMWLQDMGRIYDRKWEQMYTSRALVWETPAEEGILTAEAEIPNGTSLSVEIRSATAKNELAARPWQPVRDGRFKLATADRCLQYRVTFQSNNGDRYPILDVVTVRLLD